MLSAEDKRRSGKMLGNIITQADLDAKDREGLCKAISLEIYFLWTTFSGMAPQLSLTEIMTMPTWLRKDLRYLHSLINRMRLDRKESDEWLAEQETTMNRKGR